MSTVLAQFPPANMTFQRAAEARINHNGGTQPITIFDTGVTLVEGDQISFTVDVESITGGSVTGLIPGANVALTNSSGSLYTGTGTVPTSASGTQCKIMSSTGQTDIFRSVLIEKL